MTHLLALLSYLVLPLIGIAASRLDLVRRESQAVRVSIATAAGARTSLFVKQQSRLYVAVPHRGSQHAAVQVFEAR